MINIRDIGVIASLVTLLFPLSLSLPGIKLPGGIELGQPAAAARRDAWIYPDAAGAKEALQSNENINAVKVEFLRVNDDGTLEQLNQSEEYVNGYSPENVAFYKRYSREQFITVAGHMEGTARAMENPATIPAMAALANKTDFGIELDWEEFGRWTPEYYQTYKSFLYRLAVQLQEDGHKLMVNGPPIFDERSQSWYQWKYEEIAPIVDFAVMMVYDNQYDEGVGSSIAPRHWSGRCMDWLKDKAGSKGIAGIAAYGYSGNLSTGRIAVNTSEHIARLVSGLHVTRSANDELVATDGEVFYAFSDERTLQNRIAQVEKSGIRRLSVWSLGDNPWVRH